MSAEIIPFDFEEQAVRVVMRDGDPWFVAADVCRVLELGNTAQAVSRLDDDERDGIISDDTVGRSNRLTIISESGLYALVLTSRKPEARRFRKWITAEVLPALRTVGRYDLPIAETAAIEVGDVADLPIREAELWLSMVREARLTRGSKAAAQIWLQSPLPPLLGPASARHHDAESGRSCLEHLLSHAADDGYEPPVGRVLVDWMMLARSGDKGAVDRLNGHGLRAKSAGLFVAGRMHTGVRALFSGTKWADGEHYPALQTIPGAQPAPVPYSFGGVAYRGLILPWGQIEGRGAA